MGIIGDETVQCARIEHECSWCGQPIAVGDSYVRWRWTDGIEAITVKMHPECGEAQQSSGYDEWAFGCGERPAPQPITER
jgi:hypothetical protein